MSEFDKDVIVALADNSMNIRNAGKALFMCYEGVTYRIGKIKKETGLNPRNFHDLCTLYRMVCKERKNNDTRTQVN